jgi:hypothetical protein
MGSDRGTGKATDAQIDLRLRGGKVMMKRFVSPEATRDNA